MTAFGVVERNLLHFFFFFYNFIDWRSCSAAVLDIVNCILYIPLLILFTHTQDKTISSLKKKNQELEKLRFVLDFQLNELKKQTEPQQDDINEKKERIQKVSVYLRGYIPFSLKYSKKQ